PPAGPGCGARRRRSVVSSFDFSHDVPALAPRAADARAPIDAAHARQRAHEPVRLGEAPGLRRSLHAVSDPNRKLSVLPPIIRGTIFSARGRPFKPRSSLIAA